MRASGEGMAHKNRIVTAGIQCAVGFVCHVHRCKARTRLKTERVRVIVQPHMLCRDECHCAAFNAMSKSSMISSMCSMPTDTRTMSGVTPADA